MKLKRRRDGDLMQYTKMLMGRRTRFSFSITQYDDTFYIYLFFASKLPAERSLQFLLTEKW